MNLELLHNDQNITQNKLDNCVAMIEDAYSTNCKPFFTNNDSPRKKFTKKQQ